MEPEVKERCANPGAFYKSAEEVLADENLSATEKEYILKSMAVESEVLNGEEDDLRETGEHPADLTAIHQALNELGQGSSLDGRAADAAQLYNVGKTVFSRIVSALTGKGDLDLKVVEMTAAVARLSSGEVTFVSVVPPRLGPTHYGVSPVSGALGGPIEAEEDLKARMDARRSQVREILTDAVATPSPYHLDIRHGQVDDEVLRAAEERMANLIIVGSHDRSWIEGLFSSETAHQVASFAECPVLIVPEEAKD